MTATTGLPRGMGRITRSLSESAWYPSEDLPYERFAFRPGRIFLGATEWGFIGHQDDRHLVTVAGSRAGKGTSLIVPNLLFWPGSCIAIDPKGELATITASRRGGIGSEWSIPMSGKAYALDPFERVKGPAVDYRASFNPLSDLNPDSERGQELANMIADALVIQQEGAAAHWTQSARSFLRALILYVAKTADPGERTLIGVRNMLMTIIAEQNQQKSSATLIDMMRYPGTIRHGAQSIAGKPPNERGSVLSTCDVQTDFLEDKAMRRVLTGHDFRLEDMKTSRITVYLCLPANRLGTHGRWFRMMVGLALDAMERTGEKPAGLPPVLFCLDEFAALGHMQALERAAGQIASFGVKLWPILQDLTQLQRDYGAAWETFLGNAGTMMFWGNSDLTTCQHVSDRLGVVPVETESSTLSTSTTTNTGRSEPDFNFGGLFSEGYVQQVGGSQDSTSTTSNESSQIGYQLVPMLSPAEFSILFSRERQRMALFFSGELPVSITRCDYYDDAHEGLFAGLYDPAPDKAPPRITAEEVLLRGS